MSAHPFSIGELDCVVLQEGGSFIDRDSVAALFPDVARADIEAALGDGEPSGSLNLLLIHSGGGRILVDVGFGEAGPPGMGGALRGLDELGIAPGDIDIIFITHFHADHIAGLCDKAGAPVYANARYITTQAEWEAWMTTWEASSAAEDQALLAQFRSLEDHFTLVSPGDEIAPGVSVVDLAGHTPGQAGLLLESAGQRLLLMVDLLLQAFQFTHLDWHLVFDMDGAAAAETRKRVLAECADEQLLTLFYHLGFPGLGTIARDGEGFAFTPVG
ncbi:MAG: MBL fold metallo-hydrolase [Chloroflexi bacterium]|nr:MBL fold metallo-hydrolase [Chloroflexota bacterium]MCY3583663.1 MBL fold metallo-hydrolase [Chloroflexota bacterium]MCY3715858.1 MBL fold metallo-hydrolase [Chloroflexota bacterium]MDE2649918.1 MBL fold metallo-hydrolase [Chloroflexota bacterium]MXX50036.1 MBL fold metallo-hydrolase [Chloroflexota bacterium]